MNNLKKYVLVLVAICCTTIIVPIAASAAQDSLTFIGHATVKIKTADGLVIYIDPFAPGNYTDSADAVLISHEHSDHNVLSLVKQKSICRVIRANISIVGGVYQTFTVGMVTITAVPAYNSNHPKSSCVGYVLAFNGIKLYHAGDTGEISEMADLAAQHITYALLPMDGIYNMSPEQATSAAATIGAEYTIPIHTMPPPDTYSDAIVARFTAPSKLIVHNGETIALLQGTTSVGNREVTPTLFELCQNYPNPFNPGTTIQYSVPRTASITMKVYDITGSEVSTLVEGVVAAGAHSVIWNATGLSSGVYFYVLRTGGTTISKKLNLLK